LILEIVGGVVSGTASITDVSDEVPVVAAVTPLTVLDPTTIDLTYLSASFDVSVYVELVADPMVEHVVKSIADVQLCQEYVNDMLIGAATKETVEVKVELTAVAPLGAVVVATTGVMDLYGPGPQWAASPFKTIWAEALYSPASFLTFIQG
jgi:hypothetical protein